MADAMTLITPSSVSATGSATASITGNGKVEVTGVTSSDTASIEGIFSSSYYNYLLVFSNTLGAGALLARLRVGGSDATGGNYDRETLDVTGSSITGTENTGETSGRLFNCSGSVYPSAAHVYMFGPNLAAATCWRSIVSYHQADDPRMIDYGIIHTLSTAYTGLTLIGSTGTACNLQVFGFNK